MAEYTNETALLEELYQRVRRPSGEDRYLPLQFNLVTYDDGQQYVVPLNTQVFPHPYAYAELNPASTAGRFLLVDVPPFTGVTEFR